MPNGLQSQFSYRAALRRTARLFWRGLISQPQFEASMFSHLRDGLTAAFHAGLTDVGLKPDDMTFQERLMLQASIVSQQARIPLLAEFIGGRRKADGFPFAAISPRIDLWANRWLDFRNQAKFTARNDPKLEWIIGPTEKSCASCLLLNGHVHRQSVWKKSDVHPQSRKLVCRGYNCLCRLDPTTKPGTRGRIPLSVLAREHMAECECEMCESVKNMVVA